ncbi:MAG: aminotransferase, partial [Gemmatimonadales bacterium]|nr:aminotransferase [Gemmatimonadales bacterium]
MAAQRVLESGRVNYLTGEEGRAFEAECATYLGSRHAVALSNGTVALELAYRALGVGPGDDVIVPARTFIATAAAAVAVGARPVV